MKIDKENVLMSGSEVIMTAQADESYARIIMIFFFLTDERRNLAGQVFHQNLSADWVRDIS